MLAGLLCLLLMGFAGDTYGSVRFEAVGSPTEVINTGRSEVTGSITLFARGTGNVTGTSTGGDHQIATLYTNPAMQIDNTATSGIRLFFSTGFVPAFTGTTYGIVIVQNIDVNGRCSGSITINMAPGATPVDGDFIRLDGVRGRIDASLAVTPGTDLFVDLQSINDPAAANFSPDRIRVAKSFDGMNVTITPKAALLCFPTLGTRTNSHPGYNIKITEGFARAFVDNDANNDGSLANDRVDSGGSANTFERVGGVPVASTAGYLGAPTNSTWFLVWLEGIPGSVSGIVWESTIAGSSSNSRLILGTTSFSSSAGTASAYYSYQCDNQTNVADITVESFTITPSVILKTNSTITGTILAAVSLAPDVSATGVCDAPSSSPNSGLSRPRFLKMFESDSIATNNPPDDPHLPLVNIIRCNCYLLFTYVTSTPAFNTGIAVANTTGDTNPFGSTQEAPDQLGKVTFYFYDKSAGYVGATTTAANIDPGKSFVDVVSAILPAGVTTFSGYIIAKAEFQFCHAFAFIADSAFANLAQGYVANIIPDPAIKGGVRSASDAGDITNLAAGEGLNN